MIGQKFLDRLMNVPDNTNAKLKQLEDAIGAAGVSKYFEFLVATSDWTLREDGLYVYTVNHNLDVKVGFVFAVDSTTLEEVNIGCKMINRNRAEIYSTDNSGVDVFFYGNIETNPLDFGINDNLVSTQSGWSSKKTSNIIDERVAIVDNKCELVQNELKQSANTSYTTVNGVKEFTCKSGYVDNISVQGKTLVNLRINIPVRFYENDGRIITDDADFSMYKPSTTYTAINLNNKKIYIQAYNKSTNTWVNPIELLPNTKTTFVLNTGENICSNFAHVSDGWANTDASKLEFKQSLVILEGDHTNNQISYFEGLKSIGQGDRIDVLTYDENIWNGTYDVGYFNDTTETLISDANTRTTKWINCTPNTTYFGNGGNRGRVQFRNGTTITDAIYYGDGNIVFTTPSNCTSFRIYYGNAGNFIPKFTISKKVDKKQISTTLRSTPNGLKDEIIKQGDKYYKAQRCFEVTLNGLESGWASWGEANANVSKFYLTFNGGIKPSLNGDIIPNIICDKFSRFSANTLYSASTGNIEGITIGLDTKQEIIINILKTKLTTQDVAGFKAWLASNPVTIVYELATPIITEIPNFNPRTFSDKTTFLCSSGVVQAEANFEVTNSLGSSLDVMANIVSNLFDNTSYTDIYVKQFLNGFFDKKWSEYNNPYGVYGVKCKNVILISGFLGYIGTCNAGTYVCKLNIQPKRQFRINVDIINGDSSQVGKTVFVVKNDGTVVNSSSFTCTDTNALSFNSIQIEDK